MDDVHYPDVDDVHYPDVDDVQYPDVDDEQYPDVDDEQYPDVDDEQYPDVDDVQYPDVDDVHYPDVDDVQYPDMDDVRYPDMDDVQYPDVDDVDNMDNVDNVDPAVDETQDDNRISMSLRQFCRRAKDLLSLDQTAFVSFVLTGQDIDGSQACIDPVFNRVTEDYRLHINRDYDSLLGICDDILIDTNLTVYPVSKLDDTLSRNIHIRYDFTTANGSLTEDVHKVPNICIGKWGVHNMVRALIPGLYDPHIRSPFLTQEDQTTFYEQGLLPAVKELCTNRSAEWPARYTDEMFRARGRNGTLSFQTKMIPQWNIRRLASTIRTKLRLAGVPWATGITFLHQIRGVKDSTYHRVDDFGATQALDEFLTEEHLDRDEIMSTGSWWIDIGVQVISADKDCLAYRTDSHRRIVQEICKITADRATRLTSIGSSHYTRDMTSHLPQISGCRIEPGVQGRGPYEVAYLQLYCTDKSLTYRQDQGHHGKFITCSDVIKGKADSFINGLYSLYLNAIDNNYAHARMEVRVPVQYATNLLLDLNEDVIRRGLVSFPSVEWWSLRAYRAKAIQLVLGWQAEGTWELRAKMSALLLTAGCVWLLNGLHSAPDNRSASRELMDCILPEVDRRGANQMFLAYGKAIDDDDDDDDDASMDDNYDTRMKLPANPHGLVFFHSLRIGQRHPVPRLRSGKDLSDRSFYYLFGIEFEDIGEDFFRSASVRPSGPLLRSKNKSRRTKRYVPPDDAPPPRLFHLQVRGVELQPPVRDEGSDFEEEGEEESEGGGGGRDGGKAKGKLDEQLTQLWLQFIQDVTQLVPNRKRADENGYCKLSSAERAAGGEGLYKNLRLSKFFNDCQWRVVGGDEWEATFDHLFPLGEKPRKTQNYPNSVYFTKWKTIKSLAGDQETLETIRRALKSKFDTLLWFPCAQADRIWATRVHRPHFKKFINDGVPAPWVICRRRPSWK